MSSYQGFAYYYDILTQNIPYEKRGEYFNAIIKMNNPTGNILVDLGCGTGTLCEIMTAYGYDVIGIDNSCDMLNVAMDKRYESGKDIMYLCQNMDSIDLYGTMDVCICALDTLNHLLDLDKLRTVFKLVSLFLHPNGVFIFDVNTIYKHQNILANNTYIYDCDEVYCAWQNSLLEQNVVEISLDLFCKDGINYKRISESFCERAYTNEDIISLINSTNLKLVNTYGDDTFEPPTDLTQRAIYVVKSTKILE